MKTKGIDGIHPMLLLRPQLNKHRLARAVDLDRVRAGQFFRYAGIVTVRQQPPTAKGTMFISLEDETGNVQVIVWPHLKENSVQKFCARACWRSMASGSARGM